MHPLLALAYIALLAAALIIRVRSVRAAVAPVDAPGRISADVMLMED